MRSPVQIRVTAPTFSPQKLRFLWWFCFRGFSSFWIEAIARNAAQNGVDRQFTTRDARSKLKHFYSVYGFRIYIAFLSCVWRPITKTRSRFRRLVFVTGLFYNPISTVKNRFIICGSAFCFLPRTENCSRMPPGTIPASRAPEKSCTDLKN